MSITIKVYWRKTHLGGVLMVIKSFRAPFPSTPEPSIPIRGVFIGISLVWGYPHPGYYFVGDDIDCIAIIHQHSIYSMVRNDCKDEHVISYGKVIPSPSSRVKMMGPCHWFWRRVVVSTSFLYFLFLVLESPSIEVPPKIMFISGSAIMDWLSTFLFGLEWESFFKNWWR